MECKAPSGTSVPPDCARGCNPRYGPRDYRPTCRSRHRVPAECSEGYLARTKREPGSRGKEHGLWKPGIATAAGVGPAELVHFVARGDIRRACSPDCAGACNLGYCCYEQPRFRRVGAGFQTRSDAVELGHAAAFAGGVSAPGAHAPDCASAIRATPAGGVAPGVSASRPPFENLGLRRTPCPAEMQRNRSRSPGRRQSR